MLDSKLEAQLSLEYNLIGGNEFVGYIDGNSFELEGVQTTNGQILQIDKTGKREGIMIHSHPKTFGSMYGFFCIPSSKDYTGKELLGNKTQYLYCGNNYVVVY